MYDIAAGVNQGAADGEREEVFRGPIHGCA